MKGDKYVGLCDRNCNFISPMVFAPGNKHESPLLDKSFILLKYFVKQVGLDIRGSIMSLDGAYDCKKNRKRIFNLGMVPNIPENNRNRKHTKRGRKRIFSKKIFKERFQTIERCFAWEDKFKRLLLRFERKSKHHYGLKYLAFALINLRHFC